MTFTSMIVPQISIVRAIIPWQQLGDEKANMASVIQVKKRPKVFLFFVCKSLNVVAETWVRSEIIQFAGVIFSASCRDMAINGK